MLSGGNPKQAYNTMRRNWMGTMMIISRLALVVMVVVMALASVVCAGQTVTTGSALVQADETKAREHYVLGESAMKSGDLLTAVVEFETVLRLKPSSAYTAKLLAATAPKLGDDGKEALAHYYKTVDLQDQGKLDDAGKELGLALTYQPNDRTPQCLTDKAVELAKLQQAVKAAQPAETKSAADVSKTAVQAKDASKPATSPVTAAASTGKPAASATKAKVAQKATPKVPRMPNYGRRNPYYSPPRPHFASTRSRLKYVHGYTINGRHVPGHYTITPKRPVKLRLPPP